MIKGNRNVSNPGQKKPFIQNVLEPANGHYIVIVRMPTDLAKDFPSKPWGTKIDTIGLPPQQITKFADFQLIDVQPVTGDKDLYWIFQKLSGPIWTTWIKGTSSLIPPKFKRFISEIESRQDVVPETEPDTIAGDLIQSIVARQDGTGKAIKTNTVEILVLGPPLPGQLTDTWGVNTTEESLVADGEAAPFAFGIKKSEVSPLGGGKSIKYVENYPSPHLATDIVYRLEGQEQDPRFGIVIDTRRSLVNAATAKALAAVERADGWWTDVDPLDKYHSIMIGAKLSGFPATQTWEETGGMNLPDELQEIGVIWDADGTVDSSTSDSLDDDAIIANDLGWSVAAEALIAGSVSGRIYHKLRGGLRGNARVTVVRTFHLGPPLDPVTEYLFRPVYASVSVSGKSVQISRKSVFEGVGMFKTQAHQSGRYSEDKDLAIMQLGPFEVANGITITHRGTPSYVASAFASGGGTPPGGLYPVVDISLEIAGSVDLEIPEGTEPLQSGDTYIAKVNVEEWKYGIWIREVYTVHIP